MISEEQIAQEFVQVITRVYPSTAEVLTYCYVKVVNFHVRRLRRRFYYITVYCPSQLLPVLRSREYLLKDIAENMGLIDVVCIKADNLLRDPMSKIKEEDPRLWLELHWIIPEK